MVFALSARASNNGNTSTRHGNQEQPKRRTLVPKGMDPIIDFGTCYTSTEAVFEPPSSFVMISAPGFFTSGVSRSLRAVIPGICENQVEMCCSLG